MPTRDERMEHQNGSPEQRTTETVIDLVNKDMTVKMRFVEYEDLQSELEDFVRATQQGNFKEAEEIYEDVLYRHEDRFIVVLERAEQLLLKGDYGNLETFASERISSGGFTTEETGLLQLFKLAAQVRIHEYRRDVSEDTKMTWSEVVRTIEDIQENGDLDSFEILKVELSAGLVLIGPMPESLHQTKLTLGNTIRRLDDFYTKLSNAGRAWEAQKIMRIILETSLAEVERSEKLLTRILFSSKGELEPEKLIAANENDILVSLHAREESEVDYPRIVALISALNASNIYSALRKRKLTNNTRFYHKLAERLIVIIANQEIHQNSRLYLEWRLADKAILALETFSRPKIEDIKKLLADAKSTEDMALQNQIRREIQKLELREPEIPPHPKPKRLFEPRAISGISKVVETPDVPLIDSPVKLLWEDIVSTVRLIPWMHRLLFPWSNRPIDPLDELFPSFDNIKLMFVHGAILPVQVMFIIYLPLIVLSFPFFLVIIAAAGFMAFNALIFRFLDGEPKFMRSTPQDIGSSKSIYDEHWTFLGNPFMRRTWLQANLDRLSLTFRRDITSFENSTNGVLFDFIHSIICRNIAIGSSELKRTYTKIQNAVLETRYKKIVIIAHGLGGIQCSQIVDLLLNDVPTDLLRRVEIYTFGNAAKHFNAPLQHSHTSDRVIGHIEHYANEDDFFAKLGVIGSVEAGNPFHGLVFRIPGNGNFLNQHYLSRCFPLDMDRQIASDAGSIMNASLVFDGLPEEKPYTYLDSDGTKMVRVRGLSALEVQDFLGKSESGEKSLKLKDISRLWQYRGGRSPVDKGIEREQGLL